MSVRKPNLNKRTPTVVNEASSVALPHRDAEDQPCPSLASPLLEMDDNWDALRDWGPSPTADDYALCDEIRPEYLPEIVQAGDSLTSTAVCAVSVVGMSIV